MKNPASTGFSSSYRNRWRRTLLLSNSIADFRPYASKNCKRLGKEKDEMSSIKAWANECLKLKEIAQQRNLELSDFEGDYVTWQQVYFDLKEVKYESYQAGNGLTEFDKHAIALIYEIASNRFATKQSRYIQAGKSHWEKYYEYMQSIAWAQKRHEALKRAGHKCQLCGDSRAILQVHHNSYKNMGNEPLEDLIVLCTDCHEMFHRNRKVK